MPCASCLKISFWHSEQNRVLWVLKSREDILRHFLNQLLPPERVILVVVNDAHVLDIKRNIVLIRGDQHNGLAERMCQSKLIQNIWISASKLSHQHAGGVDPAPYLVNDLARTVDVCIGAIRLQLGSLNGGLVNRRVIPANRVCKLHPDTTRVGNCN